MPFVMVGLQEGGKLCVQTNEARMVIVGHTTSSGFLPNASRAAWAPTVTGHAARVGSMDEEAEQTNGRAVCLVKKNSLIAWCKGL